MPPTICLNMIVKNEAHVIARSLRSVKHLISRYVIVDTGSTDDTKAIIEKELEGIEGEIHDRPFVNFGHNRTEAIQLAAGQADYLLVLDADDEIVGELPEELPYAVHVIVVEDGGSLYHRAHLFPAKNTFRYMGVCHEVLDWSDRSIKANTITSLRYIRHPDSLRGSKTAREKFMRDALMLEDAIKTDPGNARYVFYLAQSWRDAGEAEKALAVYEVRAKMPGWEEERWNSLYQIAVLKRALVRPESEVIDAFLRAFEDRPTRLEAMWELGRYLQTKSRHQLCFHLLKPLLDTPPTTDHLFVNMTSYLWGVKDLVAGSAFHVGDHGLSRKLNEELLSEGNLPAGEIARVTRNAEFLRSNTKIEIKCEPSMRPYVNKVLQGEYNVPLNDADVVLDIGANVGAFAIWASFRWPNSKIWCFEPNTETFEILHANTKDLKRFYLNRYAIANLEKHGPIAKLYTGKENSGQSSLYDLGEQTEETTNVPVLSPKDLPECDVMKVDTEGCELEIIEGYLASTRKKPKIIMYEWHRERDRERLLEILSSNGYMLLSDEKWALARGVSKWTLKEAPVMSLRPDQISPTGSWQGREGLPHYHDAPLCKALVKLFEGVSVNDFGCGNGSYVKAFRERGIKARGFDGNHQTPFFDQGCITLDLTNIVQTYMADWGLSLEVGEHISAKFEDTFIGNVTSHITKGLVISWAVEGQPGDGHVNCRNNDYVEKKLAAYGYVRDEKTEKHLRDVSTLPWFKNTIMVFRSTR